jgi:glutathione S-transferase
MLRGNPIKSNIIFFGLKRIKALVSTALGNFDIYLLKRIHLVAVDRFKCEVLRVYEVLEIRLSGRYSSSTREYLAGHGRGICSIADINAWAWIRNIQRIGFSDDELAQFPHLQQWVDRIAARPAVKRGLGEWYDEDVHPELLLETSEL